MGPVQAVPIKTAKTRFPWTGRKSKGWTDNPRYVTASGLRSHTFSGFHLSLRLNLLIKIRRSLGYTNILPAEEKNIFFIKKERQTGLSNSRRLQPQPNID